jgi:hypothetical protein
MTVVAEEIEGEGGTGRRSRSEMTRVMGNITFWFGRGTSIGPPMFSSDK